MKKVLLVLGLVLATFTTVSAQSLPTDSQLSNYNGKMQTQIMSIMNELPSWQGKEGIVFKSEFKYDASGYYGRKIEFLTPNGYVSEIVIKYAVEASKAKTLQNKLFKALNSKYTEVHNLQSDLLTFVSPGAGKDHVVRLYTDMDGDKNLKTIKVNYLLFKD